MSSTQSAETNIIVSGILSVLVSVFSTVGIEYFKKGLNKKSDDFDLIEKKTDILIKTHSETVKSLLDIIARQKEKIHSLEKQLNQKNNPK